MGEVQKQRYICKICSKSCVSGKSLGGHMRIHLALISASKKAAKEKAKDEITMDCEGGDDQDSCYQLRESTKTQSNSSFRGEEKINKNRDSNTDSEDADQNNSYELRENPKKTWRFSDPKRGVSILRDGASCKECGKEFLTLRALSGHMRTHSIKNKKEIHQCKECGKGFDSMRAMYGHMKSHPKRSRVTDDSADSLSDLENLCPVRKKRSTIRYKSDPSPCLSNLNESTSDVFGLVDVEEVAMILIMLSRGVRDWSKSNSVIESSGDDFVFFGADLSCRSKSIVGDDGDLVCDVENKIKMSSSSGKIDFYPPSFANGFKDSNVSGFVNEDEIKVDDDEKLLGVENETTKVDLKVSDDRVKVVEHEQLDEFAVKQDCCNAKDFFVKLDSCNNVSSCVQESGFETNSSENEAALEISNELEKKQDFLKRDKSKGRECPICFKVFPSGQALGGHKRAHYTVNQEAVGEVDNDLFDLNYPVAADKGPRMGVGLDLWWVERAHEHEALVLTS